IVSTGETVPLIGIDVISEANNHQEQKLETPAESEGVEHLNDPDAIWTTRHLGRRVGEKVSLLINDQAREYVVRGFVPASAQLGGNVVVMDIAAAQAATGTMGRVDRILLSIPKQRDFDYWRQELRAALPPGVELNAQGSQTA